MAQSITTVLDKNPAGDLSLSDVLYIIQGTDANRDRNVTLEKLRNFLQLNNTDVVVTGGEFKSELKADKLAITDLGTNGGSFEFNYNDGIVRKNSSGVTLWKITGSGTELSGEILLPNLLLAQDGVHVLTSAGSDTGVLVKGGNSKMEISGDVSFSNGIEIGGSAHFKSSMKVSENAEFDGSVDIGDGLNVKKGYVQIKDRAIIGDVSDSSQKVTIVNGNVVAGSQVSGDIVSKRCGVASSDMNYMDPIMENASWVTRGLIFPVVADSSQAISYYSYYDPSGTKRTITFTKDVAMILVGHGTVIVGGSSKPCWGRLYDSNTTSA